MQVSRNPFDGKNNRQYRIGNVRCLGSEGRIVYVYMYFSIVCKNMTKCMSEYKSQITKHKQDSERRQGKKARKDDFLLEKEKSEGQTTKHAISF